MGEDIWGMKRGDKVGKTQQDSQFVLLYKSNYSDMYYFAKKVLGSNDVAEDVVQETFVVAYRRLDDFLNSPSPKGWLYRTLRNIIGDTYRKRSRMVELFSLSSEMELITHDSANIMLELENEKNKTDLEILFLVYCNRYTYQEISDMYGISINAAKKARAKSKSETSKRTRAMLLGLCHFFNIVYNISI